MKNIISISVATLLLGGVTLLNANEITKLDDVQVVTTAGGYEQNVKDATASISVITAEELEKKSYSDVTDALKNIPGVNVTGSGSNKTISIRGLGQAYTLFLIDGKPAQSSEAYAIRGGIPQTQSSYMPPIEAIERIEIIRGPASALYGSDAMGGVINIITKKHSDKVTASIRTEYLKGASSNKVNDDTSNTTMFVNAPLIDKTLSLQINAGLTEQKESKYNISGADPKFERKNVGGKLVYTPDENNTIGAGYSYYVQERTHSVGKSSSTASYTKTERSNFNVDHEGKFDNFQINSYITYDKDKSLSQKTQYETIVANTYGTYFFNNNSLSIGVNYKKEKLKDGSSNAAQNPNLSSTDKERYQWALFAEDTWQATDDLALTISGRYDKNEQFGSQFSPKAYAVYSLTDNLNLKGGITTGYKAPEVRKSYDDVATSSMGGAMIGNPDLEPEKSVNYETGLAYENTDIGLAASLMLFQTDFKNRISRTPRIVGSNIANSDFYKDNPFYPFNSAGYTQYYNIDKAQIRGIELTTEYDILENLKYRHSYTFMDTEQKSGEDKGKSFTDTPKHIFNVGIDWDVTSKLLLWTQLQYNGKTGGVKGEGGGALSYVQKKAYTVVDLGTVYNYDKKLSFTAGVYNIANTRNKKADETLNRTDQRDIDGRRYSVAMNLKF